MNNYHIVNSKYFVVAGISHEGSPLEVREQYSINDSRVEQLINDYKARGGEGIFVLSTCNRSEIYALCNHPSEIHELIKEATGVDKDSFENHVYTHTNEVAIRHLFEVGVGLRSQIPGDFQIIGQIKAAFKKSKKLDASHPYLERLINALIRCSKRVKNETSFSTGTTSTSYAAVEYIRTNIANATEQNVLLYGSGKIGSHICQNLVKNIAGDKITVINRTDDHAISLAKKCNCRSALHSALQSELNKADIVIVSTSADTYTVDSKMIDESGSKTFIDLSLPRNIDPEIASKGGHKIVGLDILSDITSKAIAERNAESENVNTIVSASYLEFMEWLEHRKFVPTLNAIREKLGNIQESEIGRYKKENNNIDVEHLHNISSDILNKITAQLSNQLRGLPSDHLDTVKHLFNIEPPTK